MSEKILVWLLIEQDGALLLGRRKAGQVPFAAQWILPGDLMRDDESASEAIERFGHDQLDIRPAGDEFFDTLYLQEDGIDYAINLFRVTSFIGRPRFRESGPYDEMRWVPVPELSDPKSYPMPGALRESLAAVKERSET